MPLLLQPRAHSCVRHRHPCAACNPDVRQSCGYAASRRARIPLVGRGRGDVRRGSAATLLHHMG